MPPLIIWRVSDGRRGHDSQSRGLAAALARHMDCRVFDLHSVSGTSALAWWLRGNFPPGNALPDPDLIIGAGHGTHGTLLAARRARGGRVVVLMRPTLPGACFDLCIVPTHDPAPAGGRVLRTLGPLNLVDASGLHDPARGLILLGGPARHFSWDPDALLAQARAIVAAPGVAWTLSDSPRTPAADRASMAALAGIDYVPWDGTDGQWLPAQLGAAGCAWISCDSVSMIFEALSAGVAVGVLELPLKQHGRVSAAVADLCARGMVTPFSEWQRGQRLAPPATPLREADRCAAEIGTWLRGRGR